MEQGFITLFVSSTWSDWKTELSSSCLRLLIIREVKSIGYKKHVCRFFELSSVCPCIVSLISKMGGNRYCALSKEWEQWLRICEVFGDALVTGGWKYKVVPGLFLVPFMHTEVTGEGFQAQGCFSVNFSIYLPLSFDRFSPHSLFIFGP